MTFSRITTDLEVMGGQPTIRGLRMPVATVVAMVTDGMAVGEIIAEHPHLTPEKYARLSSMRPRLSGNVSCHCWPRHADNLTPL